MATSSRALATDPLRSFKFNVNIPLTTSALGGAGGMARLGFMSVSGLGLAIEALTYREGGDNLTTRKMPGQADFNAITLSRGLFPTDNDNWVWMQMLFSAMYGQGATGEPLSGQAQPNSRLAGQNFRTPMYINILEHPSTNTAANIGNQVGATYPSQGIVQVSFLLFSAWIGTIAYSDLDAGGNAVAVEQMTINYEGFEMNWGGNGYVTPNWS